MIVERVAAPVTHTESHEDARPAKRHRTWTAPLDYHRALTLSDLMERLGALYAANAPPKGMVQVLPDRVCVTSTEEA